MRIILYILTGSLALWGALQSCGGGGDGDVPERKVASIGTNNTASVDNDNEGTAVSSDGSSTAGSAGDSGINLTPGDGKNGSESGDPPANTSIIKSWIVMMALDSGAANSKTTVRLVFKIDGSLITSIKDQPFTDTLLMRALGESDTGAEAWTSFDILRQTFVTVSDANDDGNLELQVVVMIDTAVAASEVQFALVSGQDEGTETTVTAAEADSVAVTATGDEYEVSWTATGTSTPDWFVKNFSVESIADDVSAYCPASTLHKDGGVAGSLTMGPLTLSFARVCAVSDAQETAWPMLEEGQVASGPSSSSSSSSSSTSSTSSTSSSSGS